MGLKSIRVAGNKDLVVDRVAICSGSGSSLLAPFFSSKAQVFVSGDFRYHDARDAEALNRGLIDIGHFASEHLILDVLVDRINEKLAERRMDVQVKACEMESDPFILY